MPVTNVELWADGVMVAEGHAALAELNRRCGVEVKVS
jgi:hypothetical protein